MIHAQSRCKSIAKLVNICGSVQPYTDMTAYYVQNVLSLGLTIWATNMHFGFQTKFCYSLFCVLSLFYVLCLTENEPL